MPTLSHRKLRDLSLKKKLRELQLKYIVDQARDIRD